MSALYAISATSVRSSSARVCGLWFVVCWWLVVAVVVCWWLGLLLIQLQQKGHFLTLRNIKEVGEGI